MARVSTQLQPLPTLQAAPEAPRLSPAQVPRRWALEVLAGPALTYRRLGAAARPDYPVPSSSSPTTNFYTRTGTTTSVTEQELPTGSFGAQVQVRRVLTGRWSVSTGLGYQEYATRLNLRTVPATIRTISPTGVLVLNVADSAKVSAVRLRDTYRFLTVPVRASYRLGAGGRHLGLGLLAGADVAWYLGGASAEGSACGCTSQALGRTGSPYRPLSLALSLGLDLRYRLGPRWELLAQPTASYFLNSLARPTMGFVPRYLLGGSALLGISYGLR